ARPRTPVRGALVRAVVEVQEGVDVRVHLEDDVTAVAAVATVGPAERLELLPVDRRDAVAAVAGGHVHGHAVDESGHLRRLLGVLRSVQAPTAVMETVLRPRRVPKVTAPGSRANSVSSLPRPTPRPGWKWVPR